jgi:hypothetical protein
MHVPAMNTESATFALDFAPHFGMFARSAGADVVDQLRWMHDQGFRSLEDNGMRGRPVAEQERIARGDVAARDADGRVRPQPRDGMDDHLRRWRGLVSRVLLKDIDASIEVAKRVNAKWATVVMGTEAPRLEPEYQTANGVEILRAGAERCEKAGLVMVLEPLNRRDHPNVFLTRIPQAFQICRAVDSPSCKILFDIYHQQITEGTSSRTWMPGVVARSRTCRSATTRAARNRRPARSTTRTSSRT